MTAAGLAIESNPFAAWRAHSAYTAWRAGEVVRPHDLKQTISPIEQAVHEQFREFVADSNFSCVGAKAAISGNCYRFGFYKEMSSASATAGLAHDLWTYVQESTQFNSDYATFVASFAAPFPADEQVWEEMLWMQLQSLHEFDRPHHDWDATVSSDPESPEFSFSFANTGFFIVGLHPESSRLARRFAYPTLVFNFHRQFEQLRQKNQFERMRQTIRGRDLKLQGSLNPNLSNYGEQSEARQYSGRAVEKQWRCPFKALFGGKSK